MLVDGRRRTGRGSQWSAASKAVIELVYLLSLLRTGLGGPVHDVCMVPMLVTSRKKYHLAFLFFLLFFFFLFFFLFLLLLPFSYARTPRATWMPARAWRRARAWACPARTRPPVARACACGSAPLANPTAECKNMNERARKINEGQGKEKEKWLPRTMIRCESCARRRRRHHRRRHRRRRPRPWPLPNNAKSNKCDVDAGSYFMLLACSSKPTSSG